MDNVKERSQVVRRLPFQTNSVELFKIYWLVWRALGINTFKNKFYSVCYDVLMSTVITFWYPIHLVLGLLMLPSHGDIFKNMSIAITCFICSLKFLSLRINLKKLHEIEALLDQLDKRVASLEELEYFSENVQKTAKVIAKIYFVVYVGTGVSGILTVLMNSERRLMYPAWFPFDWNSSLLVYRLTLFYQAFGVTVQIVQNMVNDIFTPVMLCLMAGHVRLLGMRLRKIGNDQKRNSNHHLEVLKNCMENHIQLRQLFKTAEDSLSLVQLLLFISSGLNICVTLVYLLFYVNSFVGVLYYTIFLTAITMEVFPIYFYGSVVQQEFEDLTYAMFCSNWIEQPQIFRRNMLIFLQNTLPKMRMVGGGIVGIQLDTFFLICRSTYSIFTLIRNINRDN